MSGCADVCVYAGDADPPSFSSAKIVTARKEHRCEECSRPIAAGQKYERVSGKWDGNLLVFTTCLDCYEIRGEFCCDGFIYGTLWSDISEQMFDVWRTRGPFDCLARLKTEAARDLCRVRFAEWLKHRTCPHGIDETESCTLCDMTP